MHHQIHMCHFYYKSFHWFWAAKWHCCRVKPIHVQSRMVRAKILLLNEIQHMWLISMHLVSLLVSSLDSHLKWHITYKRKHLFKREINEQTQKIAKYAHQKGKCTLAACCTLVALLCMHRGNFFPYSMVYAGSFDSPNNLCSMSNHSDQHWSLAKWPHDVTNGLFLTRHTAHLVGLKVLHWFD